MRYLRGLSEANAKALYAELFDCQKKGLFTTPVLKTFKFEDVCEAVEYAEANGGRGKVLFIPDGKTP